MQLCIRTDEQRNAVGFGVAHLLAAILRGMRVHDLSLSSVDCGSGQDGLLSSDFLRRWSCEKFSGWPLPAGAGNALRWCVRHGQVKKGEQTQSR